MFSAYFSRDCIYQEDKWIVLTKSWNEPKRAKTSWNNPKKLRNDPKYQNWGNLEFPTSFRYLNFEPKYRNLGILDQKVLTFYNLNKMSHVPYFWMSWFQIWHFRPKSINFLILAKFRMYPISMVVNSNLTLIFERFEPKSPIEPKTINFLILMKFCLYPILRVQISNLTSVFENFGIS